MNELNKSIEKMCSEISVGYIPIHTGLETKHYLDAIHLNKLGQIRVGKEIYQTIKPELENLKINYQDKQTIYRQPVQIINSF